MTNENHIVKPISVKPDKIRLANLLDELSSGNIQVPVFQRDFVWKPNQMIELFDSIFKGYPIGSMLFWKPGITFDTKHYIGPYPIKTTTQSSSYILDGYQRVTTLFGVLTNPKTYRYEEEIIENKDFTIYYNLRTKEFTYFKTKRDNQLHLMPLYKVLDTYEYLDFIREIEKESVSRSDANFLIESAKQISKIFYDYEIPFVEIKGGDVGSAVQIFSRVNSTGTEISEDFMLSALAYRIDSNFLFSEAITEFLISLSIYNFSSLKRDIVLYCISSSKGRMYFDVKMDDLLKPDLETLTRKAFVHIRKAVEFLYTHLHIFDVRLLPYPNQLIFISEFYRINPDPTDDYVKKLKNWFWITSYSNYFTIYTLSQQRSAYQIFIKFAYGEHADGIYKLNEDEKFITAKYPDKLSFTGVRTKILQLFMIDSVCADRSADITETYKEFFIFNTKDRSPANIVLRLGSEFESKESSKSISAFLINLSSKEMEKYFISSSMIFNYMEDETDMFIKSRENLIKTRECRFVEDELGIIYTL